MTIQIQFRIAGVGLFINLKNKLMKPESKIRKWGRGLAIFSTITFVSLLTWANWNAPTITEKLPKIEMTSFDLSRVSDGKLNEVRSFLRSHKGITAAAVSGESGMATVTFHPGQVSGEQLLVGIARVTGSEVTFKKFNLKSGGCPVRATSEFFGKLKQSLCFRD